MKVVKKILIYLLIFLIALAILLFCSWQFYIKPKYMSNLVELVNSINVDEFEYNLEDIVSSVDENDKPLDNQTSTNDENLTLNNENSQSLTDNNTNLQTKKDIKDKDIKDSKPNLNSSPKTTPAPKSKQEEILSKVDEKDKVTGFSIAKKLDVGYLAGFASGGITSEERKEISRYLRSRLTNQEVDELKRLINKYSYLLN